MRKVLDTIRLAIFLMKGGSEMMAMLFATYIVKGTKTFADVPPLLRTQVAKILIEDFDLASAVPTAFGGTLAQ